jgi:hypothetical protein
MGYDLHITRRKSWSSAGPDITADEWIAFVQRDPELRLQPKMGPYCAGWAGAPELDEPWLDWSAGQIYTKNPDPELITKMVAIADHFGATVQGDDGEVYRSGSEAPQQQPVSLVHRILGWLGARQGRSRTIPLCQAPFRVGDRVRDVWGNVHTVVEVDPTATHGLGIIRTRSDTGAQRAFSMCAHGLTLAEETRIDAG